MSLDSKAKVKIGDLSREGKRRTREPIKALDHDYQCPEVLVPLGILDVQGGNFSIYFGTSAETSDFIVEIFSQPYVKVQFLKPRTKLICGYDAQLVFILCGNGVYTDRISAR
ncbi:MAG: transposase [Microcystis novacekii Mn_MB_F_20050700_S1]|nr:MAG: transposase [Microcystis novacekii Mn_MB_F_20050700_S1]